MTTVLVGGTLVLVLTTLLPLRELVSSSASVDCDGRRHVGAEPEIQRPVAKSKMLVA